MTIQPNIYYYLLGTVLFILTWLFVGIYRDNEFYEPDLFIKFRPTFKINFYSPTGQSDLTIDDLNAKGQVEEIAFQEFVIRRHIQNNNNNQLWYLPLVLIQLTLTFFSFATIKSICDLTLKKWHLPAHFAICIVITLIGLVFILSYDNLFSTVSGGLLIFTINCWTLMLLTNYRNKKFLK